MPPLFLKPDVDVGWSGERFELRRAGTDVVHPLWPAEALALLLLGQSGSASDAAIHLEALGADFVAALDHVATRFTTYLGPGPARALDPAWWGEKLPAARDPMRRREAAPAALVWMVTLECNRRCPYCFYRIIPVTGAERHRPRDSTLTTGRMIEVIEEMARIGTADLYLTGGEPLLRDDLLELVAVAAKRGIRAHAVTKYAIDPAFADQIAASGMHDLTISLDDLRPEVAKRLTGVDDYPAQALASIRNCLAAGVGLEVNAVVTAVNESRLGELACTLAAMGLRKLTVSPLQPPHFRNANVSRLLTAISVEQLRERLQAAVGDEMTIAIGSGSPADQGASRACGPDLVCEVGLRSLDVLPNGGVTRCHYLPARSDILVGSLTTSSIMEIWNGAPLRALTLPDRDAYAGSSCHGCGGFDACNSRGRCLASAILENDSVFGPDAFCTRVQ